MNFEAAPKWPINTTHPRMIARQAAFVVCHRNGRRWSGAPSNADLCLWLGLDITEPSESLLAWFSAQGKAIVEASS